MQMLHFILGVRESTPTDVILAESSLVVTYDVWLLRAARFWKDLASKPLGNLHKQMAA